MAIHFNLLKIFYKVRTGEAEKFMRLIFWRDGKTNDTWQRTLVLTDSCWLVAKVCADWLSSNTLHPMLVFWFGGSSCVSSHMTNSLHLLSPVNLRLRVAHIKWSTNSCSPGSDSSADGTPCLASMAFLIVPGITLLVYFPKWHAAHLGTSAAVMLAAILCSLRIVWVVASAPFWNRNCTVLNQMCPSW